MPPSRWSIEAEFGGDHHLVAQRRQRFADQFFIDIGPIDFRRVEESDAELDAPRGSGRSYRSGRPAGQRLKLMPMQPRPRAETSSSLLPKLRFCIVDSGVRVSEKRNIAS